MGKPTGFLEYGRKDGPVAPPRRRVTDFAEFHAPLPADEQRRQAARCMDCGVPFCQYGGLLAGMASGCPLHNLVPEINDLVYRGSWRQAYMRLAKTHCLPEFTSRVCPALCEAACTCGLHGAPVATRENERAVIEYAFSHGLVRPEIPPVRTGQRVAVVGSGPAGLAAAVWLNRRGHSVTVFERDDRPGGLLRYGIPNMKLDKSIIDRRIALMEASGIEFRLNADVGRSVPAAHLLAAYDRVLLAGGARRPRDLAVPGRDAAGVRFAVDFLTQVTKALLDSDFAKRPEALCKGRQVLVIGGGDTGNDCVATALRLGAAEVTQLEMMPRPPAARVPENPWPQWPRVEKTDYGQQEAAALQGADPRRYQTTVQAFKKDRAGRLRAAVLVRLRPRRDEAAGRTVMEPVAGSEEEVPCQLALIAAGFLGSEAYLPAAFGAALDSRGNVAADADGCAGRDGRVFVAGDMRRGQSLVVWAIAEGEAAARAVDRSLMGYSNLNAGPL